MVSGDFYWISDRKDYVYYATADCTGHGVPGGFMSMLGMAILNEIVDEMHISDCGDILNLMREKIISGLKQYENSDTKDGMDLVLLRIDKNTNQLQYASANNPFYIIRNEVLTEYKASKMPVGIYNAQIQPFTSTTIPIQQNDIIYTFSDGYADQFGGEKHKKLGYKNFREKLTEISKLKPAEQKSELEYFFENWKANQEQIDDICIIGIKIT